SLEVDALAEILGPHLTKNNQGFAREIISDFQRANNRYAFMAIADLQGNILIASAPGFEGVNIAGEASFREGSGQLHIGDAHESKFLLDAGVPVEGALPMVVDLSAPILDEQSTPTAVLCAYVEWDWMRRRFDRLVRPLFAQRAEIMVLRHDQLVLLSSAPLDMEGQTFDVSELADPDRRESGYLYGQAKTPPMEGSDPGWTVLIRKPTSVALAPVLRLQRDLFIAGLIGAALAAVAGWLVSGFFTRPIAQLAHAARQIAEGHTGAALPAASRSDEIGALTGALRFLLETRERQAQELRYSFRQFTSTFENAAVGIAQISLSGHWLRVNQKIEEITGYSAAELRNLTFQDLTHPDDLSKDLNLVQRLIAGEIQSFTLEKRYIRKDQRVVWASLTVSLVRNDMHEPDYFVSVVNDVTDQKIAAEELRQSEERFRNLIEHAADGVFIADLDGVYLDVNTAACRMLGHDRDELIGRRITEFARTDDLLAAPSFREWLTSHREAGVAEWEFYRKDGSALPVEVSTRVLPDQRWLAFARDITERRHVDEQLRQAKESAEAASRAKDHFLAALSHELRTPLNPVLMLASEHENDATLPEGLRADFATIRKNIALEARLIDDLLDLTRITRGKLKLELIPLDVHEVVHQAFSLVSPDLEAKQIVVTLDLSAPDHVVVGDPVRLQQVFWNVIINAVKFTPPGGTIVIRSRNGAGRTVFVEVQDSGLGITPEELPCIFNAFSQGDHSSSPHRFGGLGLGLSIVRLLLEMHQGRIRAESGGAGKGATFAIELPLSRSNATVLPPVIAPEMPVHVPRRILLVEDHEPTRSTLSRLLRNRGHEVQAADSIGVAKALAAADQFDLVVSDLGLPDGSGHDLMLELSSSYGLRGIALSGYGMDDDVQRSTRCGFVSHLHRLGEM
ncbi:MAG: PAS domain S-box protein, partial [Chthoniobacteraceae bacterium]